jgi:uncharacterized protein YdiU (UPF0061 family)
VVINVYIEDLKYFDEILKTEAKARLVFQFIQSLKQLKDKSTCPLCRSCIDKNEIKNELEVLEKKLEEFKLKIKEEEEERKPIVEEERKKREIEKEVKEKEAVKYLDLNISLFKKLVKQYRHGDQKNLLPKIPEKEKEIWNRAMKKFLGNSHSYNDIDEFDLMFDL